MPPNRGRQKDGARQKIQAAKLPAPNFCKVKPTDLASSSLLVTTHRLSAKTIAHRRRPVFASGLLQQSKGLGDRMSTVASSHISLNAKGLLKQRAIRHWTLKRRSADPFLDHESRERRYSRPQIKIRLQISGAFRLNF